MEDRSSRPESPERKAAKAAYRNAQIDMAGKRQSGQAIDKNDVRDFIAAYLTVIMLPNEPSLAANEDYTDAIDQLSADIGRNTLSGKFRDILQEHILSTEPTHLEKKKALASNWLGTIKEEMERRELSEVEQKAKASSEHTLEDIEFYIGLSPYFHDALKEGAQLFADPSESN